MIYLYSIKLLSLLILYFINLFIREKKTSKKSRKIESSQEKRKTIEIIAMSIYINIMWTYADGYDHFVPSSTIPDTEVVRYEPGDS